MKSYALPLSISDGRIEPEGSDLTRVILLSNPFAVMFSRADWSETSSTSKKKITQAYPFLACAFHTHQSR